MKEDVFSFGACVFNDEVMQKRFSREVYEAYLRSADYGEKLDLENANIIAKAMRDWAIENGATHFCHWFMPMTGAACEKHEAFIRIKKHDKAIYDFSGKDLIKGESDASSFPSGGLRAAFEARGYTTWDVTSHVYIRDGSLYIPTAFCSYTGEALDKKTPLLRSIDTLSKAAIRLLRALGIMDARRVFSMVGAEQEYFLVDKELFEKRYDLRYTGRTLIGKPAPKGQELNDHYYGSLKEKVSRYMQEVDRELWKLGIGAKTRHNEVAPAQHEIAPIYTRCNLAADANYLIMDVLKKVANKHGMVCLLHEKPFRGVNGSGKHNNWSLKTDSGLDLLDPTKEPENNKVFLATLAAVLNAVYNHAELLLMTAASAGNDERLGSSEAPPSIMSVYLGEDLTNILEGIKNGTTSKPCAQVFNSGVSALLDFAKDNSDRNRTSPFAFTGNKFEFRMIGASGSIAGANAVLNTIVAHEMDILAQKIEEKGISRLDEILSAEFRASEKIIFNGNNYSKEWHREAKRRGLKRLENGYKGLGVLLNKEKTAVLQKWGTFSAAETLSRYDIYTQNYINTITVEARTLLEMAERQILPAVDACIAKKLGLLRNSTPDLYPMRVETLVRGLIDVSETLNHNTIVLRNLIQKALLATRTKEKAEICSNEIVDLMNQVRSSCDVLEALMGDEDYPIPSYGALMFSI